MKVSIITNESFPLGMATTNRILTLALGLISVGVNVTVYLVRPTEKKDKQINYSKSGIYKEIHFRYTTNSIIWPDSKIKKLYYLILGPILFAISFIQYNRKEKHDAIISTTTNLGGNLIYFLLSKIYGIGLFVTSDEYPIYIRNSRNNLPGILGRIYLSVYPKLFDGFIVMTNTLIAYWKKLARKNAPFIHIPMTVDINRFEGDFSTPEELINRNTITYCGNLGHNEKDGVPILIKSFSKILAKGYNYYLIIIGDAIQSEQGAVIKLKKLVKEIGIEEKVIFTGKKSSIDIPKYIMNSTILALARPNNKQAEGGFPTKLGEYLASKRPVVVTATGEIPLYLNSNNCYICKADSVKEFTEALENAINDPNKNIIGLNGYKLALNKFDYRIQGKKIKEFIFQII